jgi:hypothetical protein
MSAKEFPPITIRLVNTKPTEWVLQGTEKDAEPVRRDSPGQYRIIPTCVKRKSKDSKEYERIRHIYGCQTIVPEEQVAQGYEPDLQMDNIWLPNGMATFRREGNMIGTYDYIKNYQGNVSNPLRPMDAEDEFEEVVASEVANTQAVDMQEVFEAMEVIKSLGEHNKENNTIEYDEERIDNLCMLLNIDRDQSAPEKYLELSRIAQFTPATLLAAEGNKRKNLILEIKKAKQLNLIVFEENKVFFASDNMVLLTFKGKLSAEKQINKLLDYFLKGAEGEQMLNMFRIRLEQLEKQSLDSK